MKNWNTELTSYGEYLTSEVVDISEEAYFRVTVCQIVPRGQIFRGVESGYTLKNAEKLNHLLFMDDLKIFAKSELEMNGLVSTVQIFSNDIGMEFGIKKFDVLVLKIGKVVSSEGVQMSDGERIEEVEENGYKYLGILEYNKIKENEMKENFRREHVKITKLIMKITLNGRNKIMTMNIWAVSLMRYDTGIVKWTKNELDEIDRKTRKVMTMNN